jgi:hypothetical protein
VEPRTRSLILPKRPKELFRVRGFLQLLGEFEQLRQRVSRKHRSSKLMKIRTEP